MAIYDYSSGGFPASPVTDDTLAMKGTTYKYNGSAWEVQTGGTTSFTYTATSGQTAFTGADTGSKTLAYTAASIHVFLNGVLLDAADYTATDGTTVTLAVGATTGDTLQVVAYGVLVAAAAGGGGGAWEVVSHQTVSSSTLSVSFTGLSNTYTAYKLIGTNVANTVNGSGLGLRFSQDGGSTFDSASNYAFNAMRFTEASSSIGSWASTTQPYIPLNSAGRTYAVAEFELTLGHVNDGMANKNMRVEASENQGNLAQSSVMICTGRYSGANLASTPINALQVTGLYGGTIATGNFTLYGIKTS